MLVEGTVFELMDACNGEGVEVGCGKGLGEDHRGGDVSAIYGMMSGWVC